MFSRILVPARADGASVHKADSDLLTAALGMAGHVTALCIGPASSGPAFAGLCHECVVSAHMPEHPDAAMLAALVRPECRGETVVLLANDSLGLDVGPGLAVLLGLPFLSNVRALGRGAEGEIRAQRVEENGQMVAEYAVRPGRGVVCTIMPSSLAQTELAKDGRTARNPNAAPSQCMVRERALPDLPRARHFLGETSAPASGVNLSAAQVLVAVGRGLENPANLALAETLASLLGGEVCCSRAVADAGWLDKDRQVGLSGHTVSPAVYLTLGLHGAFQHMAGVAGSPRIIAVNTNPDAPIFQYAEIAVVADAASFAAALIAALK